MPKISRKLALAFSVLLVLSQWLSLAHATEHLINVDDTHCQICTLQHHFHSVTLDAKPCVPEIAGREIPDLTLYSLYLNTSLTNRSIRAPPR